MKSLALMLVCAVAVCLTACQKPNNQPQTHVEQPYTPLTQMEQEPPTDDAYVGEPVEWDAAPAAPADEPLAPAAGGARTHVVCKGDTLYRLARQYYNDQSKWKVIWEANRAAVPDKNVLRIGTRLTIP
ncbi:MAG: LysM domain-containing protein [Phycisphaerae bacterium]